MLTVIALLGHSRKCELHSERLQPAQISVRRKYYSGQPNPAATIKCRHTYDHIINIMYVLNCRITFLWSSMFLAYLLDIYLQHVCMYVCMYVCITLIHPYLWSCTCLC